MLLFIAYSLLGCSQSNNDSIGKPSNDVAKNDSPTDEVVNESAQNVAEWSAKLIERSHGPADSDAILIDLLLESEQSVKKVIAKNLVGPFILLKASKKIFACEENSIMGAKSPILIELNGSASPLAVHVGELRDCEVIPDTEHVLLQYSLMKEEKPFTLLRVISPTGEVVIEKQNEVAGNVDLKIDGITHTISVSEPTLPW